MIGGLGWMMVERIGLTVVTGFMVRVIWRSEIGLGETERERYEATLVGV